MEALMTNVGAFFTQVFGWIPDVVSVISENPILLIFCVAMPIAGFVVGLLNRVKRV